MESKCGTIGWGLLAAGVIAWDVLAPETLSHAVDRALEHKTMRYVAWGVGGIVTAHLFNVVKEEHDLVLIGADAVVKGIQWMRN